MFRRRRMWCGVLLSTVASALWASGASVNMRVVILNPRESSVTNCDVHKPLPQKVTPKQILDAGGLNVAYDVESRLYYVEGTVAVQPGTNKFINIRIADIWNISDKEIDDLLKKARDLVEKLKGRDCEEEAQAHLVGDVGGIGIEKKLEKIRVSQNAAAIRPGLKGTDHITAYESDLKLLDEVVRDIRYLENLALKEGIDLDSLVWDREVGPQDTRSKLPTTYKTAVYRVWERNPAEWERHETFKTELPPEIGADDVLNAGALEVTSVDGHTYVGTAGTNEIVLGPKGSPTEEVSFNIQIRDKWDINEPRIVALREIVSNVVSQVEQQQKFKKMEAILKDLSAQLEAIAVEKGPATLDSSYVAFFNDQAQRLDVLEHRIRRIAAALNPQLKGSKIGFAAKPPSSKTTWGIIWAILAFLGLMSFLFFMFHRPKPDAGATHVGKTSG